MSYLIDVTTTNQYQYLQCPGSDRFTIQISNAAAAIGFGSNPRGIKGAGVYPPFDEPFLPMVGGISRPDTDEIRVKSYAVGVPANVKVHAT